MRGSKEKLLIILEGGFSGHVSELCKLVDVKIATLRKNLNILIKEDKSLLEKVQGFIPESSIIVDIVEYDFEKVSSDNFMEFNRNTKRIIDSIIQPEFSRFLKRSLASYVSGSELQGSVDDIIDIVIQEFIPFLAESGNGATSIVGALNEEIVLRSLENSRLLRHENFEKTGKKSNADIIVHSSSNSRSRLYVEVKSYHARERLLRGLQDINHPEKVGFGFFVDPSEFNESRTQTLINSNAWAIYIPDETYEKIDDSAKGMTTAQQQKFYRPASLFVGDMETFSELGKLSEYS